MDEQNESFSYTYSAKQQEEVKRIRQKYIPPEADKLEQLRRLDESATRPGGVAGVCAAYPIHTKMVKHRREQLVPQVIQLSQELMGEP